MSDNTKVSVLKELVTVVTDLVELIEDRLADGWQWVGDSVAIGAGLIPVVKFVPRFKEIFGDVLTLEAEDVDELVEHFKAELDLDNDKAEDLVETVVDFTDELFLVISFARDIYARVKGKSAGSGEN